MACGFNDIEVNCIHAIVLYIELNTEFHTVHTIMHNAVVTHATDCIFIYVTLKLFPAQTMRFVWLMGGMPTKDEWRCVLEGCGQPFAMMMMTTGPRVREPSSAGS